MEKEVTETERRGLLKRIYLQRINEQTLSEGLQEQEVYALVRKFFAEYLKLDYEFTYEELSYELNKIYLKPALKQDIDKMILDLSNLEYLQIDQISQEDLKAVLNDFKELLEQMIAEGDTEFKKPSFFEKLFKKKEPKSAEPSTPIPVPLPNNQPLDMSTLSPEQAELPELVLDQKGTSQEHLEGLSKAHTKDDNVLFSSENYENKNMIDKSSAESTTENTQAQKPTKKPAKASKERAAKKPAMEDAPSDKGENMFFSTEDDAVNMFSNTDETSNMPSSDKKINGIVPVNVPAEIPAEVPVNMPTPEFQDEGKKIGFDKNKFADNNENNELARLRDYIRQSYSSISLDEVDDAIENYEEALNMYKFFSDDRKEKVYLELYELYLRLKEL